MSSPRRSERVAARRTAPDPLRPARRLIMVRTTRRVNGVAVGRRESLGMLRIRRAGPGGLRRAAAIRYARVCSLLTLCGSRGATSTRSGHERIHLRRVVAASSSGSAAMTQEPCPGHRNRHSLSKAGFGVARCAGVCRREVGRLLFQGRERRSKRERTSTAPAGSIDAQAVAPGHRRRAVDCRRGPALLTRPRSGLVQPARRPRSSSASAAARR